MLRNTLAATAVLGATLFSGAVQAQETIKVGILHSLSGTMAISETTLKDAMLMLIEEQMPASTAHVCPRAEIFAMSSMPPRTKLGF